MIKKILILAISSLLFFGCSFGEGYLGSNIPMDGLAAWYAADEKINKDGSNNVSAWGDISGNGHDLTISGGLLPWVNNVINNKPIIRFDNGNGFLQRTSGPTIINNELTIFIAMNIIGHQGGLISNTSTGFELIVGGNPAPHPVTINPGAVSEPSFFPQAAFIIYGFVFSSNKIVLYKNGNAVAELPGTGPIDLSSEIRIGSGVGANESHADIAEFIIYKTDLDDDARKEVEDYLMEKYAI